MRIGVNCFPLRANIGGLKQKFLTLFDWLLEHDSENEYIFYHFPHNLQELEKLHNKNWNATAVLLTDQEHIRLHLDKLDLYFCPFGALWPRPIPLPSVVTLVDIQEVFYPQFFTSDDLLSRAFHFSGSTRAADRVITISEYSKQTIGRFHRIAPDKITVAYLCADPAYFSAAQIACPPDRPLPGEYLFYPANRWLHKNHDGLLRAILLMKQRGLRVNGVFSGFDVDNGYPLLAKAHEFGIEDQIHLTGYVTIEQMAHLYVHARLLVFPSLFEGFGMPPLEAMAAGCPAAVSKTTSLPEICGEAALYFDPTSPEDIAETIQQLWRDASLRETLLKRGRERASEFSPARMAEAHLRAFREARAAYSPLRNRWQRFIYQPYHRHRVHLRHWVVTKFRNSPSSGAASVTFASGWYQREGDGDHWIRWASKRGRLIVTAPKDVRVGFSGEMASLRRPNRVDVMLNRAKVACWPIQGENFGFNPIPAIVLQLRTGRNVIDLVSQHPPVSMETDPRKLSVAFRDLALKDCASEVVFRLDN